MNNQTKKKSHQMRPSLFLNQFDINTFIQSPILKTENIEKKPLPALAEEPAQIKQKSRNLLPNIVHRFKLKKQLQQENVNDPENMQEIKKQSQLSNPKTISEQVSPVSGQQVILPEISLYSPQYSKPTHKKNFTEEIGQSKRVEFRASILVIDFVNDILRKDKIDGSSKPLTKKLERKQTKFLQPLAKKEL